MNHSHDTSVIILGAGPAGLSLGRELALRHIPYLILEKQANVGSTFADMTESTTFGPWLNNTLPGGPVPWTQWLERTTRASYVEYLKNYALENQLRVLTLHEVVGVRYDGGFEVRIADGNTFKSDYLVNATGIFSKPYLPHYPGMRSCRIPVLHSAAYRSPRTVRELTGLQQPKVLIVGSRLSAGEIAQELYEAGCHVHLSHRGRIDTWPSKLEETLLSPFTYLRETVALRLGLGRPSNLRPRMRRGQQYSLLQTGKVRAHPDIARLEDTTVRFVDGARDTFDLILYATGYRPALDHLKPLLKASDDPRVAGLESLDFPGCFFLGLSGSRSFRSEFLRGIREDAVYLANLLEQRLLIRTSHHGSRVNFTPATFTNTRRT